MYNLILSNTIMIKRIWMILSRKIVFQVPVYSKVYKINIYNLLQREGLEDSNSWIYWVIHTLREIQERYIKSIWMRTRARRIRNTIKKK